MKAFPEHSRHSFFAGFSDAVGGVTSGGRASPGIPASLEAVVHTKSAGDFFHTMGKLLWSRTGPGYIYNTFFADGNVVETVREDSRPLDEAFGIYRTGGFSPAHASTLTLSRIVDEFKAPSAFAELSYVKRLNSELDKYWNERRADWTVLARYQFIREARRARDSCIGTRCALSLAQYRQVMAAAAPHVPLEGPITLAQLRQMSPTGAGVRRFDINGYPATDIVRFIAADKSEIVYIPGGDPSFVIARSEEALRAWVFAQARDPKTFDELLSHFSIYNTQDSMLWTGVRHGLEKIGNGQWEANADAIDHGDAAIDGDVFEDMRAQTEARLRQDANMQSSTAWEAWRTTINRTAVLLGPLGYAPPLALPLLAGTAAVQFGTGVEQAIDGKTEEERRNGVEQAGMASLTAATTPAFARFENGNTSKASGDLVEYEPFASPGGTASSTQPSQAFVPPRRVNGQIGYPMSPVGAPKLPVDRLYLRQDGSADRWIAAAAGRYTGIAIPKGAIEGSDGILRANDQTFVRWRSAEPTRGARVVISDSEVRIDMETIAISKDRRPGPLLSRRDDGTWDIEPTEKNYLKGSLLAQIVDASDPINWPRFTRDARTLHRAAGIMEQLGLPETQLQEMQLGQVVKSPLAILALGHGFVESLPARLRDPTAVAWNEEEVRVIAPIMAKAVGHPLAFYNENLLDYTAMPDGSNQEGRLAPYGRAPTRALDIKRIDGRYHVADDNGWVRTFDSAISAVAWGKKATARPPEQVEANIRNAMAEDIEGRSTLPELRRIHEQWIPKDMHAKSDLIEISQLRHVLFDGYEIPTPRQVATIKRAIGTKLAELLRQNAGDDDLANVANEALTKIIGDKSGLLPEELDHLVVKDPTIVEHPQWFHGEDLYLKQHRYVRLRDFHGRTQVVETAPTDGGLYRAIRVPGEALGLGSTHHQVVDIGSKWIWTKSPAASVPGMLLLLHGILPFAPRPTP
jgi:hypothetical protein